jgi:hypothetical protein
MKKKGEGRRTKWEEKEKKEDEPSLHLAAGFATGLRARARAPLISVRAFVRAQQNSAGKNELTNGKDTPYIADACQCLPCDLEHMHVSIELHLYVQDKTLHVTKETINDQPYPTCSKV